MNLFVDYVQPLTEWLHAHPHWALFITFIVSLSESFAIIGSIVPGSVTMTAVGILAGAGVMRIDLTLLAAILGAVCGDGLSYALGFFYSEKLTEMWPFKKYPSWLKYGKDFFIRHGGKSVFLGRFVGPLRSLIPVIAGIMHMSHWRFFLSNVMSAIGWSILYVMPGVVIGAAGQQLSAETATRFFMLVLLLLAAAWALSFILKWFVVRLNSVFRKKLHVYWSHLKQHPTLYKIFNAVTPQNEENHYSTVLLLIMIVLSFLGYISLLILNGNTDWLAVINNPIHLISRSFHTDSLEAFFIICTQLTSYLTISILYSCICLLFILQKNNRGILFLTSVFIFSSFFAFISSYLVVTNRPSGLLVTMPGSSFLATNLEIATAVYGFILLYTKSQYALFTNTVRTVVLIVLGLSGIATVYLGDFWFTDVVAAFLCGTTICLVHYLIYRKPLDESHKSDRYAHILCIMLAVLLGSSLLSTYFNFKTLVHNHTPYHKEFSVKQAQWWDQTQPILPIYRVSRIGKPISLLNIQFSGNLNELQKQLEQHGWVTHTESFLTNLVMRMSKSNEVKMPILAQLFENKRPELIMTYKDPISTMVLEMRIWESNYHFADLNKPIWVGSVHPHINTSKNPIGAFTNLTQLINPASFMLPSLSSYSVRRVELSRKNIKSSMFPTAPYIFLIRQ